MSTATVDPPVGPSIAVARTTGLLYLGLAVTGFLGFLLVRPRLFDPDATAAALVVHLVENESLARIGIALELGVVVTQAVAAVWFYRLFRAVDSFQAGAVGVFGTVNAVAVLVSAACLATALQVALEPTGDPSGHARLMYAMSENLWGLGGLFFGLWLIPMGTCVLRSRWAPRTLGRLLIVGGVGYVLSAFVRYLAPDAGIVVDVLVLPASVGEFWMIAYLLTRKALTG